ARLAADHQISRDRADVRVLAADLLAVPQDPCVSDAGIRKNVSVGLQYVESWLRGQGCVPINNLMEDAATAEISRAQLWQWARHGTRTVEGRTVSLDMIETLVADELGNIRDAPGGERFARGRFEDALALFLGT